MKYNELNLKSNKSAKRVGRGISAGKGKTAGRGTKGQGARKSGGVRPGFEGGQMPLYMRLPKLRGFKSKRQPIENVYTGQIDSLKQSTVDNFVLFDSNLVSSPYTKVKLISKGELKNKKIVKLQSASQSAITAINKAGGEFSKVERVARQPKKTEKES